MSEQDKCLELLRNEVIKSFDAENKFILNKIFMVTALLGVSVSKIGNVSFEKLVFLTPFIGYIYNIFIINEKHKIVRVSGFIKKNRGKEGFRTFAAWEDHASSDVTPPIMVKYAHLIMDIIILLVAIIIGFNNFSTNFSRLWFFVCATSTLIFYLVYEKDFDFFRKKIHGNTKENNDKIIENLKSGLENKDKNIENLKSELENKDKNIENLKSELENKDKELQLKTEEINFLKSDSNKNPGFWRFFKNFKGLEKFF
jgi:hypothetical protein